MFERQSFAILMPLIIFFLIDIMLLINSIRQGFNSKSEKAFKHFLITVTVLQGGTIIAYGCDLHLYSLNIVLQYIVNMIGIECLTLSGYTWLRYMLVADPAMEKWCSRKWMLIFALPVFVLLITGLLSPWTHWVFYIDENGNYQNGTFMPLQMGSYLYFLFAFVVTLFQIRRSKNSTAILKRFLLFMLPAAIGGFTNILLFRGGYVQIGCSMGALLLYLEQYLRDIDESKRLRSLDALNKQLSAVNEEQKARIAEIVSLNKSLEEYSDILSNAGLGVWKIFLKDGSKPGMQANKKMLELLGIEGGNHTEEETYSLWYDRILPEAIPSVQKSVQEMLDGHFSENTYQWDHPKLGVIYVRCGGTSYLREDGLTVLSGYHGNVTDIVLADQQIKQELEIARDTAEKANQAKTKFLFNMSHDIRTPMNAILGYTDIALNHSDDEKKTQECLGKIKSAGNHLLNLINDILEMSRIESGKMEIIEMPLDIRQAIAEVGNMSQALALKKSIDLQVITGEIANPFIYADKLHINEVIINLISNAIKYTPDGGKVRYSIRQLGQPVDGRVGFELEVNDNGIGMSEEFQQHLFEAFSREHNTTVSMVEGTGLGLSIVKQILDLMGGTISIQSKQNVGTDVVLHISFRVMDEEAIETFRKENAVWEQTPEAFSLDGKRVLYVEDNEINREIGYELLSEKGMTVEYAEDGDIAVKMVTEKGILYYDAILMDIQMPIMNGYEATHAIRSLPDGEKVPIIALSANAFSEDIQKSLEVGMNAHVAKPIDIKVLFDTMQKLIVK